MTVPGHERLWLWFGLSRASWLTMPRVLMHEMPDDWQEKMAQLLEEWNDTWDSGHMPEPIVSARAGHKFTKWPSWLLNYRHPDRAAIEGLRSKRQSEAEAKWLRMQNPKSAEDYGLVMTEDELKQIPEGRQIIEDVRALRELRQTREQGDA